MNVLQKWLCGLPGAATLMISGMYISYELCFVQLKYLPQAIRRMFSGQRDHSARGAISPMQSVCTALGGTMGTGNIAGVAGAMALGGPGAIFWMWIAAFFGMATKYLEVALAVKYRKRNAQSEWVGGPMYCMEAQGKRRLAAIFCVCGVLASLGVGNAAQVNTLSGSLCTLAQTYRWGMDEGRLRLLTGLALTIVTSLMALGGMRRIAQAAERLMPFVCTVYLLSMAAVIGTHAGRIGPAFRLIFTAAFSPEAALGGAAGISLRHAVSAGVTRGIFTNEAGMGSSAIAHAATHGATPHGQGLLGIFEVFADTFVVCTVTALGILTSGCNLPYGVQGGAELTTQALSVVFGARLSAALIALCMLCFAVSTLMAWSFYGMRCVEYLGKGRGVKIYLAVFSLLATPFAVMEPGHMWEMTEVFTVLMALCNMPCLVLGAKMKIVKKDG